MNKMKQALIGGMLLCAMGVAGATTASEEAACEPYAVNGISDVLPALGHLINCYITVE